MPGDRQYDAGWVWFWVTIIGAVLLCIGTMREVAHKAEKQAWQHQFEALEFRYQLLRAETEFLAKYTVAAYDEFERIIFHPDADEIPVEYVFRRDPPEVDVVEVNE